MQYRVPSTPGGVAREAAYYSLIFMPLEKIENYLSNLGKKALDLTGLGDYISAARSMIDY